MDRINGLDSRIVSDLGLNVPFVKGNVVKINNCWHFSTDGNAVDSMFYDKEDYVDAVNRIYVLWKKYHVTILAFVLMDTHVHFILYGELQQCSRFVHEYVAKTSRYISLQHGMTRKMEGVPINYQTIDDERYLKTAICYVIKNPTVAGMPYMPWTYPWSSGALYFKSRDSWTRLYSGEPLSGYAMDKRLILKTKSHIEDTPQMYEGMVLPEEFVAVDVVEALFRTCRSFNFFMGITKEEDIEARGGSISHLSIPMQEMRQHKTELCASMFGVSTIKSLSVEQRLKLARILRSKFNSSPKQIARLCGLVYSEVETMLR